MRKALIILKHEFIHTIKRKSYILLTIAIPLLLILGFIIYNGIQRWYTPSDPEAITIGYVDQTGMFDDSPAARAAADAIREDRPIADTKLQALRRFAAAMTEERGWVSEGLIDRFISAGYGRAQVLEVISGIALATMSSYTNHVAATPIEGKAGWAALDG